MIRAVTNALTLNTKRHILLTDLFSLCCCLSLHAPLHRAYKVSFCSESASVFLCVCVGAYISEDMFLKEKARGIGKVWGDWRLKRGLACVGGFNPAQRNK